jgi:hypothetical protein
MFAFSRCCYVTTFLLASIFLTGCASVVNGENQSVQVATRDIKGDALEGANCDWKNSKKSGSFVSPSVISVKRDYDTMHVVCRKDGSPQGTAAVTSNATAGMMGNVLVGGLIGAAVDHATGNAYEYPSVIIVRLGSDITIAKPQSTGQRRQSPGHKDVALIPAASSFASVSDIEAIPTKSQACRDVYNRYLTAYDPKAIVFSTGGGCASRTGPDAIVAALAWCSPTSNRYCGLYAVDSTVVWNPPKLVTATSETVGKNKHATEVPPTTHFSELTAVEAVPNLGDTGKSLYREWLSKPFPRAVAISEKGALARGYGPNAMETAIKNCEKFNSPCRLFAVDDQVVWTSP